MDVESTDRLILGGMRASTTFWHVSGSLITLDEAENDLRTAAPAPSVMVAQRGALNLTWLPQPKPKLRGKDLLVIAHDLAAAAAAVAHVSCVRYLAGGGSAHTLECATDTSLLSEFKLCSELPTEIVLSVLENSL